MVEASDGRSAKAPTEFLSGERASAAEFHSARETVRDAGLLTSMMDGMPTPAFVVNRFREIVAANRRLLRDLGVESVEDVLGARPGEALGCIAPSTAPSGCGTGRRCLHCGLARTLVASLASQRTETGECRISRVDGGTYELEVSATPTVLDDVPVVMVGLRDVSAEKRREVLEHAFLHDLMNTAGGLRGLLALAGESPDLLDEGDVRASLFELADDLVSEIRAHRQLCDAEEGVLVIEEQEVDLSHLLAGLRTLYASHDVGRGRRIRIEDVPAIRLRTDLVLLRRVLGNFLKNALEASPEGGEVVLSAEHRPTGVTLRVHNAGAMSAPAQAQVFQRSFTTKGAGRGMGTYAARLLGERYLGGAVGFRSTAEEGTTFMLRLGPACIAEGVARVPAEGVADGASEPDVRSPGSALLADDSAVSRLIAQRTLESLGWTVSAAQDGEEAWALWRDGTFDLVVLDLQMPGADGVEVARRIRAAAEAGAAGGTTATRPVLLALTGSRAADVREACTHAGFDDVLEKPVDREALVAFLSAPA